MKILLVMLSLILTMNVSAASTDNGIKAALDEFAYAMTVEGAATDSVKAQQTIKEYRDRLLSLGVSRSEIIDTALGNLADQKKAGEIRLALTHIGEQKLTYDEALIVLNTVLSNGQQGASWDGVGNTLRELQIFGIVALTAALLASVVNSTHPN